MNSTKRWKKEMERARETLFYIPTVSPSFLCHSYTKTFLQKCQTINTISMTAASLLCEPLTHQTGKRRNAAEGITRSLRWTRKNEETAAKSEKTETRWSDMKSLINPEKYWAPARRSRGRRGTWEPPHCESPARTRICCSATGRRDQHAATRARWEPRTCECTTHWEHCSWTW